MSDPITRYQTHCASDDPEMHTTTKPRPKFGPAMCYHIQSGQDTTPVIGYAVELATQPGIPAFVAQNADKWWVVSDVQMGAMLCHSPGKTKTAAVRLAEGHHRQRGITADSYLKGLAAMTMRGVPACPAPVPLKDSVLAR
jgi:hypothetical protein